MKKNRLLLSAAAILIGLSLTACGEKAIELTADEEDIITMYAAKVVAKHNVRLAQGLVRYKAKGEDAKKQVEEEPSEAPPEESEEGATTPTGEASGQEEQAQAPSEGANGTLNDAFGIENVDFTYQNAEFSDDYVYSNYYHLTPHSGKEYLVMHFNLTNQSDGNVDVDLYSASPKFTATVGGETYSSEKTILPNDLSTYVGSIGKGESNEAVLLFEVPSDIKEDVNALGLAVTIGSDTTNITL